MSGNEVETNERWSGAVASRALIMIASVTDARSRSRANDVRHSLSQRTVPNGNAANLTPPLRQEDPFSTRMWLRLSGYHSWVCLQSPRCASEQVSSRTVMCGTRV
jgi:hypothetical protein